MTLEEMSEDITVLERDTELSPFSSDVLVKVDGRLYEVSRITIDHDGDLVIECEEESL